MNDRAPPMKPTPTPEMIDAFIIAKESADRRLYGFHNLGRHFILDGTTEVWFTASDDYEVGHAAMMAQLERLRMEAALSAALSVPAAAVVGEPERDEMVRKVVGLCNRVPGATTWNAAEWMYDELAARKPVAWPIDTDDQVEALARECDWDNRKYMTPKDYAIWCERMRKFARLAAIGGKP